LIVLLIVINILPLENIWSTALKWVGPELVQIISLFFIIISVTSLTTFIKNRLISGFDSKLTSINNYDENFTDEVYAVISNTYENLSAFRVERERQAKTTYNTAIVIITLGAIILFFGVLLLFNNSIVEGSITSSVGVISKIIGGTILSFYKDTNNRMDKLNDDLFTLHTIKVQYSLINKIDNPEQKNRQLRKLVKEIGKIKDHSRVGKGEFHP
jgi:hypothetical protein